MTIDGGVWDDSCLTVRRVRRNRTVGGKMTDLLVVGAGVAGLSAAVEAVKLGAAPAVMDGRRAGGASQAGAGIVSPGNRWDQNDPLLEFVRSAGVFLEPFLSFLENESAVSPRFDRCGALHMALSEDDAARLPVLVEQLQERRQHGFKFIGSPELLSGQEARQLHPLAETRYPAIHIGGSGRLDGRALVSSMRRYLEDRKVPFLQADAKSDGIQGVNVNGLNQRAVPVVLATGAWPLVCDQSRWLRPQRGQLLGLKSYDGTRDQLPSLMGFGSHYVVSFGDGHYLAGPTREDDSGFQPHSTLAGIAEMSTAALALAPGLAGSKVTEMRVGIRPMSVDGQPIVGAVQPGRAVHVNGLDGFGLQLGPYAGAIAARLALEPNIASPWPQLSPSRFGLAEGVVSE